MAARSLFLALTRNARRDKTTILFRSISSSSSSSNEAVKQELITTTHVDDEFTEVEEKDDLKSRIFRLRLPKRSAINVLQKWVTEGHNVTLSDLRSISKDLRKSHRYKHALEISEWMISHDEYQLSESDYATRIDLMTKVFGIDAAERYFEALPSSAKTSETYTALLHCYASLKLIEKAEELYQRINGANLSLSAITYNELMTLYMSLGHLEKVPLIVQDLKRHNVAPDIYTYNLWVSSSAAALDMDEVKRVLEEMSIDSGCDESWIRYIKLAQIYVKSSNLMSSDLSPLVESEKGITQRELITYDFLIILYAGLGDKGKIDQIWKSLRMTGQKMTGRNYICVLSSYLMLGHLKEVGETIEQWRKSASSELNGLMCNKVMEAFEEVGMTDKASTFLVVLREQACDPIDGLR